MATETPTPIDQLLADLTAYAAEVGRTPNNIVRAATGDSRRYASLKSREARLIEDIEVIRKFMADNPATEKEDSNGKTTQSATA
jgi:alkanesulfonate monooxygenase SsuD/methylene tetrahydromethanopterin reductase-like flavin-dependent oxidoreductase (luciferase family)